MKNLKLRLAAPALAVALGLGMAAVPAWAYFTASDSASGGMVIKWPDTDITEDWDGGSKHIRITNDKDSVPMYVRAKIFVPNNVKAEPIVGSGWEMNETSGWFEYRGKKQDDWTVLNPGETTNELVVTITYPFYPDSTGTPVITDSDQGGEAGGTSITKIEANGTEYNVVVIYEAVPVTYEADGDTPAAPVWNS